MGDRVRMGGGHRVRMAVVVTLMKGSGLRMTIDRARTKEVIVFSPVYLYAMI